MKKTIKALFLALTCLLMTCTLVSTTFAASDVTAKIIISSKFADSGIHLEGKTFAVYKVFDATVNNDGTASTIGYTWDSKFKIFFTDKKCLDNSAAEAYIHTQHDNKTMQTLANELRQYTIDNSIASTSVIGGDVTIVDGVESLSSTDLDSGYYLVVDTSTNGSTMSAAMLVSLPAKDEHGEFTKNATIILKGSQPTIEKEIWHNDSNGGEYDDVGDFEIGDSVPFKITAVVPHDVSGYKEYDYIITDTMSKGLTFNNDIKIFTDAALSEEVANKLHEETIFTDDPNNRIFELDFDMLAIKEKFPDLKEFYITYTATLNEDAKMALNKEENKVELEYSNDPFNTESSKKVEDTVYAYSFELNVTKTDTSKVNPLANAVFGLFVKPRDETKDEYQVFLKQDPNNSKVYYVQQEGTPDLDTDSKPGYVVTDDTGKFSIKGLDDNRTYILREMEAPAGYTKADDIIFRITADYGEGVIPTITVNNEDQLDVETDGSLSTIVVNTSSELFPGTGGMGTPLFIGLGIGLMSIAGILLIKSKRSAHN